MPLTEATVSPPDVLPETTDLFSKLSNLIPDGVFITDAEGVITNYNQQAADLWGRKPRLNDRNEIRFCGSWKIYTPEGKLMKHEECPMARVLNTKESVRDEEIIVEQENGTRSAVLVNIDPLFSDTGELIGAINVLQNISKTKENQESLFRLAAIITSSEDAIISKGLDGIIRSWNAGAEKIFGYKEDEVIGKPITILIPDNRRQDEQLILGKISKGELVDHFETIRVDKYGNEIPISLTVSPIKDPTGKIIGASKIARNISSQIEIQNQLRENNEKLAKLNNYKDEFIGMASHELKTPITSIKANLQILERKLLDNSNRDFVTKTLKHISKLNGLISDLLDVSKIQAGKLQLNPVHFELNDLLEESIETVQHISNTHKIINNTREFPLQVYADRERIEQVIINLLTNAIKYSPGQQEVHLSAYHQGENTIVSIKDFGIGISSDNIDKIFHRFYRVEGLDPHFSGLGIGLYIAYEIIKRHNGDMWVESQEKKGSTFYFKL